MTSRFLRLLTHHFWAPIQVRLERNLCKFVGEDNAHGNQQDVCVDSRVPNRPHTIQNPNAYSPDTSSLGTFNKASRIEIRSISINALKICHPHGAVSTWVLLVESRWMGLGWGFGSGSVGIYLFWHARWQPRWSLKFSIAETCCSAHSKKYKLKVL